MKAPGLRAGAQGLAELSDHLTGLLSLQSDGGDLSIARLFSLTGG